MFNIELSIVIVAYKNLDLLIDCIESIYEFNDISDRLEIIIVDNSPDETYVYNYIKNRYRDIIIIKNINNGFGAANNIGAKLSRGKYILFLNPDTVLVEPIIKFAINKFENDKDLSMFGLKLTDINNKDVSCGIIGEFGSIDNIILKILNLLKIYMPSFMYISGADIFIRKNVFFDVGMFDENIFMYYEESDLSRRILKNNDSHKIKLFRDKEIKHICGGTTEIKEESLKFRLKSYRYFCNKENYDYRVKLKLYILINKLKMILFTFNKERLCSLKSINKIIEEFCS